MVLKLYKKVIKLNKVQQRLINNPSEARHGDAKHRSAEGVGWEF